MYDITPNSLRFDNDPTKPILGSHVDGVIGFVENFVMNHVVD